MGSAIDDEQNSTTRLRQELQEERLRNMSLRIEALVGLIEDRMEEDRGAGRDGQHEEGAQLLRDLQKELRGLSAPATMTPGGVDGTPAGILLRLEERLRLLNVQIASFRASEEARFFRQWSTIFFAAESSNWTRIAISLPVIALAFAVVSIIGVIAFNQTPQETVQAVMEAVVCPIKGKL